MSAAGTPRVAVVGHVEWTTIVRVDRLPAVGEICRTEVVWEGPAGGGAVAAVRVAAVTGGCALYTSLGADVDGAQSRRVLADNGVTVLATDTDEPTSRAVSLIDASGERTTLTIGRRLQPAGERSPLPWSDLDGYHGVFFTAGDHAALRWARRARLLAATTRELSKVASSGVPVDVLIGSLRDPDERYLPGSLARTPDVVVLTDGEHGGGYLTAGSAGGRYLAVPPPGPLVDTYGVGDNFAASLTVGLAAGTGLAEALAGAAADGARCTAVRGPYPLPRRGAAPTPTYATTY